MTVKLRRGAMNLRECTDCSKKRLRTAVFLNDLTRSATLLR